MTTSITLDKTTTIHRDTVIEWLCDAQYERVDMVIEVGTFCVRGSIVDVFPVNHDGPIRLDFFSDHLDRIDSFEVDTQRTRLTLTQTTILSGDALMATQPLRATTRLIDSAVISNIQTNDYVVHERYGIAIYKGFHRLTFGDQREGEYIFLQFRGSDKLYMPLDQIPMIHRYSGPNDTPRLNALYDGQWDKTCRRAHRALKELATEIYTMFKARQTMKRPPFLPDTDDQLVIENRFPFKETPDQLRAIADVKQDMEAPYPMDRIVCGDVGFGKTEVMIRAAAKAVLSGAKQVMILVPTTILCDQHMATFTARFHDTGIAIESVSRLRSAAHNRRVIRDLKRHVIDIVIGTHRLLSRDVVFRDLGLVIVDEEQRFGVKHKEKIKMMTQTIDILTTSATPIPRTLYMSLTGAKAMSRLRHPPDGRRPIQTIIRDYSPDIIQHALKTELARGGQIYFLHNVVHELPSMASKIEHWIPDIRVGVAHGQMPPSQLEATMLRFQHGECDVLLCTSIIENGLDIESANTVIINRADRLGLSQIHQIRGRVGRNNQQAYAYILVPSIQSLNQEGADRLQALKEAVGLGVGYQLAMKDLEIRGAGTLLGEKQSGHLTSIGFDLYCKLLEKTLKKVRGERVPDTPLISFENQPNLAIPATYIENEKERLAMYQRCLGVVNRMGLKRLQLECKDRYGAIPKQFMALIQCIDAQLPI